MVCGAQVLKSLITQKANKPFKTTIKSMVRTHPAPLCLCIMTCMARSVLHRRAPISFI